MPKCDSCKKSHPRDMTACPTAGSCKKFMSNKDRPGRGEWACQLAVKSKECLDECKYSDYAKAVIKEFKQHCRYPRL